jgi:alpha-galactosidase/6-phospho-beta-glucosidase family protein
VHLCQGFFRRKRENSPELPHRDGDGRDDARSRHLEREGPVPRTLPLPEIVAPYCEHAAGVTDAIGRAAEKRSRRLLHHGVELDPTIVDNAAGLRAIDACLEAHGDLLPTFHPGD